MIFGPGVKTHYILARECLIITNRPSVRSVRNAPRSKHTRNMVQACCNAQNAFRLSTQLKWNWKSQSKNVRNPTRHEEWGSHCCLSFFAWSCKRFSMFSGLWLWKVKCSRPNMQPGENTSILRDSGLGMTSKVKEKTSTGIVWQQIRAPEAFLPLYLISRESDWTLQLPTPSNLWGLQFAIVCKTNPAKIWNKLTLL